DGVDYKFVSSEAPQPTFLDNDQWDKFEFTAADGTLKFPEHYTNDTNVDQVFTVQITVWVDDRDVEKPTYDPNFPNGKQLTNTAQFVSTDADGDPRDPRTGTANVQYIEPNLTIAKA